MITAGLPIETFVGYNKPFAPHLKVTHIHSVVIHTLSNPDPDLSSV